MRLGHLSIIMHLHRARGADPEIRTEFLTWLDFRPPVDGLAAAPGLDACDKATRVVHEPDAGPR